MNKLTEDQKAQRAYKNSISKRNNAVNSVRHNRDNLYRLFGMHVMRHHKINGKSVYTLNQFKKYYKITPIKTQKK